MINVLRSVLKAKVHHLAEILCESVLIRRIGLFESEQTFWNDDARFHDRFLDLADLGRCIYDVREVRRITNHDSAISVHNCTRVRSHVPWCDPRTNLYRVQLALSR